MMLERGFWIAALEKGRILKAISFKRYFAALSFQQGVCRSTRRTELWCVYGAVRPKSYKAQLNSLPPRIERAKHSGSWQQRPVAERVN